MKTLVTSLEQIVGFDFIISVIGLSLGASMQILSQLG